LSSGEAELYAMLKGATVTIGFISLAADFGRNLQGKVHSDASAAIAIVNRSGVGKLRHIRVQYLWLQQRVADKDIVVQKVAGTENPADLMTKHLSFEVMAKHVEKLYFNLNKDRAKTAPKLALVSDVDPAAAVLTVSKPGIDMAWGEQKSQPTNTIVRQHVKPRKALFTPLRVAGAPPARSLASMRLTKGTFLSSGQAFQVVDNWTARAEAHRELREPWIGSTSFFIKHSHGTEDQFDGQWHHQPEKGYVNIDPNVNDCDFIDVHASNVDSWHVHTSRTREAAAVHTVSIPSLAPEDYVARKSRCA
jgi:hypothetical protein